MKPCSTTLVWTHKGNQRALELPHLSVLVLRKLFCAATSLGSGSGDTLFTCRAQNRWRVAIGNTFDGRGGVPSHLLGCTKTSALPSVSQSQVCESLCFKKLGELALAPAFFQLSSNSNSNAAAKAKEAKSSHGSPAQLWQRHLTGEAMLHNSCLDTQRQSKSARAVSLLSVLVLRKLFCAATSLGK